LIFTAEPTLETIERISCCIKQNIPFFPVSIRELTLPTIELPDSGVLIATSGSNGKAKQAHLSLDNLFYSAESSYPDLILKPSDHYLLSVPLSHISGLSILYRCQLSGATLVLPGDKNECEVTHISFVPTQLKRFLQNPKSYPKLKAILVGGAPIPYELCLKAYNMGFPIYITYGMTEMASQICTKLFHPKTGITFGSPLPHRELKIIDGEIYVGGKTLFQGYHNLPSPLISNWFPTKDLGRIGPNGIELLGRKDRMFISGGENIHPEEIELALLSHPKVMRAKVHARSDLDFGHRPVAYISTSLEINPLLSHLAEKLPRYKIPSIKDIILNPDNFNWIK
jgi:o-succinylbenzoate---CoA ligase